MRDIALVMYHAALGRMLAAEKDMKKKEHQAHAYAEWRTAMNVQKHMAEAEMKALEPLIRIGPCEHQVIADSGRGATLCNGIESQYYDGPCSKDCAILKGKPADIFDVIAAASEAGFLQKCKYQTARKDGRGWTMCNNPKNEHYNEPCDKRCTKAEE